MYSDKNEAIIKGRQYAEQARVFFEKISPECAIFKGGTHEQVLIYSFEKDKWECNCLMHSVFGFCAHTVAAEKALPAPVPIVIQ